MKKFFIPCLLWIPCVQASAQPDFYHLSVNTNNVKYTCYLNGFPIYEGADNYDASMSLPVQLFLVGKGNELKIEAEAMDKSKSGTISAQIDPYQQGEIVNTGSNNGSTINLTVKDKTSGIAKFDNERFDFSAILKTGEKLTESEVLAYGKQLYSYVEKGDAAGFATEMEGKIRDYAATNPYTEDQIRVGLTQQFENTFFSKKGPALKPGQMTALPYCEGRLWEIKIDGEQFLKMEEDGGSFQMAVVVGKLNGKLTIIR